MSLAKLTLIGIYNYNNTLFNEIRFPDNIDKKSVVNQIMFQYGEFEVLYPNDEFLKMAINHFFDINYKLFKKWADSLELEYDPLENYNRHEEWSDNKQFNENITNTRDARSNGNTTQNNEISSFDSSTLVDDNKSTGYASSTANEDNKQDTSNTDNAQHKGHLWGNIGVTTSQQMLESEMQLREKWQIEKIIADMFAKDLLILVYT